MFAGSCDNCGEAGATVSEATATFALGAPHQEFPILTTNPTIYGLILGGTRRAGAGKSCLGSGADTEIRTQDLLFTNLLTDRR